MLSKLLPAANLVVVLTFLTCTRADYYIDDTDPGVQYTGTGLGGSNWTVEQGVDNAYNDTYHFNLCNAVSTCGIIIPFSGTGITAYFIPSGINGSATVDRSPAVGVLRTYVNASSSNALFSTQSLPSAAHVLTFNFFNYTGPDPIPDNWSAILFDYALVNGDSPTPTPTCTFIGTSICPPPTLSTPPPLSKSSAVPSGSTPSTSASSVSGSIHKHSKIAPIIGGILGALAVVAVFVTILLCIRRRKALAQPIEESDPGPMSSFRAVPSVHGDDALSYPTPPFAQAPSPSPPSILPVGVSSVTTNAGRSDRPSTLTAASHRTNPLRAPSGEETPHESGGASPTPAPVTSEDVPPFASMSSNATAMNIPTEPQLTSEQLDFVHTLYTANVPPAEIVAVMDRMRAARGQSPGGAPVAEPPVYDFKGD